MATIAPTHGLWTRCAPAWTRAGSCGGFLQLITVGEIGKKREVVEYLRQPHPERTTDQRVQDLMHMAAFNAAGG
jgi:hypothetical protein